METISVVIPVYNSAGYLRECVDSVLGQTYPALDVILVDDGSTDESPEICARYAGDDSRVRFYQLDPVGVGATRNFGVSAARGKFLMFVDSDDVCDPSLAESLMAARVDWNSLTPENTENGSLVLCGIRMTDPDGKETGTFREERSWGTVRDYLKNVLNRWQSNPLCGGVYCKLFETEIIKKYGIRFEQNETYAEDFMFNLAYLAHVNHVTVVPDTLYRYRTGRSGSLTDGNRKASDPEAVWARRRQVVEAYEAVYTQYGMETECADAIRVFYLKNITDVVEMAVRQATDRKGFAAWMDPLRRDMRKEPYGPDFSGMPGKYRVTLSLLKRRRYGLLRGYETARRQIRVMRGRER